MFSDQQDQALMKFEDSYTEARLERSELAWTPKITYVMQSSTHNHAVSITTINRDSRLASVLVSAQWNFLYETPWVLHLTGRLSHCYPRQYESSIAVSE